MRRTAGAHESQEGSTRQHVSQHDQQGRFAFDDRGRTTALHVRCNGARCVSRRCRVLVGGPGRALEERAASLLRASVGTEALVASDDRGGGSALLGRGGEEQLDMAIERLSVSNG
jgi:hypothetical protein